ncbi:MAG: malonyl-ACP O-methyltransferase BioC [Gammaproteobacteria bacterium]
MDLLNPPRLDKSSIKKSFERAAKSYDHAAILDEEVLNRLLDRLQYIRLQPATVIDIGCGTGKALNNLQKTYPKSKIVSLDLAYSMLQQARSRYGLLRKKRVVNADMENMPFADDSFDLLFSNLALQWVDDLSGTFREFTRIGRGGSLLMFSTFGPDTLKELRESWFEIDRNPHVHQFIDMHDIGDAMMAAGFSQPVVDAETIRLEYPEFRQIFEDLKNTGASNAEKNRCRGLMTPAKLRRLEQSYRRLGYDQGKFIASYEVVYGHAWLPS